MNSKVSITENKYIRIAMTLKCLVFIQALFVFSNVIAQDCYEYHVDGCDVEYEGFKLSSQSKSAMFKLGHTSQFSLKAMEGYEYYITLCYESNLKGISLTVSDENNNNSYSVEHGERFVNLVIEESTNLIVRVDVPLGDADIESVPYDDLYGCVGVRVEYKRYKE